MKSYMESFENLWNDYVNTINNKLTLSIVPFRHAEEKIVSQMVCSVLKHEDHFIFFKDGVPCRLSINEKINIGTGGYLSEGLSTRYIKTSEVLELIERYIVGNETIS